MADGGKLIIKIFGDSKELEKKFSKVKDIAGKAAKGIAVGFGAAATGVGAIGTAAVKAYGDYEQLVGGVETLFKDSADVVQEYAKQAYQTSGMSANEYMETITGFSASLLQSLGNDTAKAAEYGNQAVIDMSDNANKMGTSMESIQNAYQGFAKQNYTMLDNLKLGYGGTKEEMQRLLKDAQKISGIKYDISSFADITQAIHVIQTEMDITGTTAKEASTTIQGSFGMMKSAWENLMVALANPNANISEVLKQFTDSVITFSGNLIPVISQTLKTIPTVIEQLGTEVFSKLPALLNELLPMITNTASQLIAVLSNSLSQNAAMLGTTSLQLLMTVVNTILTNLPTIIQTGLTLILTLAQGISQSLPSLIPSVIDTLLTIVNTLLDNIDTIIDTAIELIIGLANGLVEGIPILVEKIPQITSAIINALIRNAPKLMIASISLLEALGKGLILYIATFVIQIPKFVSNIIGYFKTYFATMKEVGKYVIEGLWNGINDKVAWLKSQVKGVVDKIKSWFTGKDGFDEHSPSKWSKKVFAYVIEGGVNGIKQNKDQLISAISGLVEDTRTEVQKVTDEMNKELLDSEKFYNSEKERLSSENTKKLSDEQKKQNEKYLEGLKETAEKERKLYDALQKDIENSQKNIMSAIKSFAEKAYSSVEEVQKAQESYADKLKGYVSIYNSSTGKFTDFKSHTEQLKKFSAAMLKLQERGDVPLEFFSQLRDLPIEQGIEFATGLANADDTIFDEYMNSWKDYQAEADKTSKLLYGKEAENAANEITAAFDGLGNELDEIGGENAEAWTDGFIAKLNEVMPRLLDGIRSSFNGIITGNQYAYAGAGGNTYNNTYTVMSSNGESVQQQIWALRNRQYLNEQRGF